MLQEKLLEVSSSKAVNSAQIHTIWAATLPSAYLHMPNCSPSELLFIPQDPASGITPPGTILCPFSFRGRKKHLAQASLKVVFFFLRFYLFIHERHRERQREKQAPCRQREKQTPCRKPNTGLDPRTLGSRPEPKADTQPLSHPSTRLSKSLTILRS